MAIFNSYVKLPEGIFQKMSKKSTANMNNKDTIKKGVIE